MCRLLNESVINLYCIINSKLIQVPDHFITKSPVLCASITSVRCCKYAEGMLKGLGQKGMLGWCQSLLCLSTIWMLLYNQPAAVFLGRGLQGVEEGGSGLGRNGEVGGPATISYPLSQSGQPNLVYSALHLLICGCKTKETHFSWLLSNRGKGAYTPFPSRRPLLVS